MATSSFGGGTATTDGIFRATGSVVATTNNVQITGSLDINGHMTASLRQGYAWVGDVTNKNTLQIPTSSFGTSLTIADTIPSIPVSGVTQLTFDGGTLTNNGSGQVTVTIAGGGGGSAGTSGTSGISGQQGSTGTNGTSGTSGVNGFAGTSGVNGTNGTSGTSGVIGSSGSNGTAGSSGTSGIDGTSGIGSSGTNGTPGTSGTSGLNGIGSAGTSGADGTNGTSGTSGISFNGTSGTSGVNGSAGTNGLLALSGTTNDGVLTYNNALAEGVVESSMTYDGTLRTLTISGSTDMYTLARIRPTTWTGTAVPSYVTPLAGMLMVSASGAGGALMYYNGATWTTLAAGL